MMISVGLGFVLGELGISSLVLDVGLGLVRYEVKE
jgi:hypothetical protein